MVGAAAGEDDGELAAKLDEAVDDYAYRLAAKPPGALHGAKLMFQAVERAGLAVGDVTGLEPDLTAGGAARL